MIAKYSITPRGRHAMPRPLLILSLVCLAMLAGPAMSLRAQVTARVEWDYRDLYEESTIEPMGHKGALLVQPAKDTEQGKRYLKTTHYDTALKPVMTDSMLIDKRLGIYDLIRDGSTVYTILRQKDGDMLITAYDADKRQLVTYTSDYSRKASIRDVKIAGGRMVFSSTQRKLDRVGVIDLASGNVTTADIHFKGVKDKNIVVMEVTTTDDNIHAVVGTPKGIFVVKLTMQCQELSRTRLDIPDGRTLVTASVSKANGRYFLTGTYGEGKGRSNGIYFAELGDGKLEFIRFYNFLELKNFTSYMSERGQKKAARRVEKAKKKGKEYTMNYLMANHEIMHYGDSYYYLGEAYYPTYITTQIGNTWVRSFNGYAYTHAVLAKFDNEGGILWDNCFEMSPKTKPYQVKLFVSAGIQKSGVSLLYGDGKRLVKKVVSDTDGTTVQEREQEMVGTDEGDETVTKVRGTSTSHWYGDNFLVYGSQVVRDKKDGKRRRVEYINKYTMK